MAFKRSRKPLLRGKRGKRCPNWWEYRGKPKAADACVYRTSSRPNPQFSLTVVHFDRLKRSTRQALNPFESDMAKHGSSVLDGGQAINRVLTVYNVVYMKTIEACQTKQSPNQLLDQQ